MGNMGVGKTSQTIADDSLGAANDMSGTMMEDMLQVWLQRDEIGLRFDPFRILDASNDPHLPEYLVGHEAFVALWGDWPSFLFAPAGGGKTAFRVRLARACRVGQDGRQVFPITYKVPSPAELGSPTPDLDAHLRAILPAGAMELLLALAYRPVRFLDRTPDEQVAICQILELNLTSSTLDHFLTQMEKAGSLAPLVETLDPTAENLLRPPSPSTIRRFCAALTATAGSPAIPPTPSAQRPSSRFERLTRLILGLLGFEAIYLLIDGVDAHVETGREPQNAIALLSPLLEQTDHWATQRIFVKYFLPTELQQQLVEVLTHQENIVRIEWGPETLAEVLRERLRVASGGAFNSFARICTPDLWDVEAQLVRAARPLPREVLMLAERLFWAHADRCGPNGKLEPEDLDAALAWYKDLS